MIYHEVKTCMISQWPWPLTSKIYTVHLWPKWTLVPYLKIEFPRGVLIISCSQECNKQTEVEHQKNLKNSFIHKLFKYNKVQLLETDQEPSARHSDLWHHHLHQPSNPRDLTPSDADWFLLVVLSFDNENFLSRNRHRVNEVVQNHLRTENKRWVMWQPPLQVNTVWVMVPDMRLKGGSADPGNLKRLAVRTISIITHAVCSSFSSSPADWHQGSEVRYPQVIY